MHGRKRRFVIPIALLSVTICSPPFLSIAPAEPASEGRDLLKVTKPPMPIAGSDQRDSVFSKFENGSFTRGTSLHVGLSEFRKGMLASYNSTRPANLKEDRDLFLLQDITNLTPIALDAMKSLVTVHKGNTYTEVSRWTTWMNDKGEKAFVSVPTPGAVTTTLIGIELLLDDLLNRANSAASSALFAMRGHVAASAADLNVMFKNRMDEAFDRLSEEEQKVLTTAQVLAAQADQTIREVTERGFEESANLVCSTTVGLANFNPLSRLFPPDIVCMKEHHVRDAGPNMEKILTFLGVNLLPHGSYPSSRIEVAGKTVTAVTAGGNSILLLPLPGGLNGTPNDLSLRGERITQVEFTWQDPKTTRRWIFPLRPYLVRAIDVTMVPLIKGPIRQPKSQTCYVRAPGGTMGSREEYATCTIAADDGWTIEQCQESPPTTSTSRAGIRNRLFTPGSCQWEMVAKTEGLWKGGEWYGFIGTAIQKNNETVRGTPFQARSVINQGNTSAVFTYPQDFVPSEYSILHGDWWYTVHYQDNEGREHTFTQAQPTTPRIGTTTMQQGQLTITLN